MLPEDVFFQTVRELGNGIRSRELSPVQLTEGFLDRSEKLGSKLNAYSTLTRDLALRQAHAAEKEIKAGHYRGPLHGVPYAARSSHSDFRTMKPTNVTNEGRLM